VLIEGLCPARNFAEAMALIAEMLQEPRFDAEEFDRVKRTALSNLAENRADPGWLADAALARILFAGPPLSFPVEGTEESIAALTMDDVRELHAQMVRSECAIVSVAGRISEKEAEEALRPLGKRMTDALRERQSECGDGMVDLARGRNVFAEGVGGVVYLVDVPGAKQAEMRVAGRAMPRSHEDYYPAFVTNYPLGGNFNSRLNMILREEKGVTYGAKSRVDSGRGFGLFRAWAAIQSDAAAEGLAVLRAEWTDAAAGITDDELEWTRTTLMNAGALEFETLDGVATVLRNIGFYGLPKDYVGAWRAELATLKAAQTAEMVRRWMDPATLVYLIAGDAKPVRPQLGRRGGGEVREAK